MPKFVADSSVSPTGLKWAAPASAGGMTLLSTTTTNSGSAYTLSSISSSYIDLMVEWDGLSCASAANIQLTFNGGGSSNTLGLKWDSTTSTYAFNASDYRAFEDTRASGNAFYLRIFNYLSTNNKLAESVWGGEASGARRIGLTKGMIMNSAAINSITFTLGGGSFSGGTLKLYGVS